MRSKPANVGRLNLAVLWHLQMCERILSRLGYQIAAAYVATAIDALNAEAMSEEEISEMDLAHEDRTKLVLELFKKHGNIGASEIDSSNEE